MPLRAFGLLPALVFSDTDITRMFNRSKDGAHTMSYTVRAFRFLALSALSAPAFVYATEPRIIVPSKMAPKVVFERDSATLDVLNQFRNARSSEQIHFQPIETLFPRVPNRENVHEGYSMVKEIVDAKKAAIEAAEEMEEERARLAAARAELEEKEAQSKEAGWGKVPEEFDYYEFSKLEPEPEPAAKAKVSSSSTTNSTHKSSSHHHGHAHNHSKTKQSNHANKKQPPLRRSLTAFRSSLRRVGRSNR